MIKIGHKNWTRNKSGVKSDIQPRRSSKNLCGMISQRNSPAIWIIMSQYAKVATENMIV